MDEVIAFTKVKLPFGWMSNMSPHPIIFWDKEWRTTEALFQAGRFSPEDPIREEIRAEASPMTAKIIAKAQKERMILEPMGLADLIWMGIVLHLKVDQHPNLKAELVATGQRRIIEDVTKRPHGSGLFWGAALQPDGTWLGENQLGRLWMAVRNEP